MATIQEYEKLKTKERQNRYFSEEFKRKKVSEIERHISTISEVCREYQVSATAVYKWIYKYSGMKKKGIKMVVESKSDTKKLEALKEEIKQLERIIGQKQITIEFQQKMIELAEEEYRVDIKKKFSSKQLSGTGKTGKNTTTK